jgi:hypothetical protein
MPWTRIDTADAIELTETLQLIARWLAADPGRLADSLLGFIGHPAYGPDALRADLDRFAFFLGGNDGEFLLGEDPCLHGPVRSWWHAGCRHGSRRAHGRSRRSSPAHVGIGKQND